MSTFTLPKIPFSSWLKAQRGATASSPRLALYARCDLLPLDIFIKVLTTGDVTALLIRRGYRARVSLATLNQAWEDIYYQYVDLLKSTESEYYTALQRQAVLLDNEIKNVEIGVYYLSPQMAEYTGGLRPRIIAALGKMGYKINEGRGEVASQLLSVLRKLTPKRLRLAGILNEISAFIARAEADNKNNKPTAETFYAVLRRLSKYMGYGIRARDITVTEYAGLLNDYLNYLKAQEDDIKKGGNK